MRLIAVANRKGGCGKTTTSINFAACLALLRKKILLLDLDPQGHSTCGLGVREEESPKNLYHLLSSRNPPGQDLSGFIKKIDENFYLIPSYSSLSKLEDEWEVSSRKTRFKTELKRIECEFPDFDYVILDCSPSVGPLTWTALENADEIIIPIEPSFFSLHGLAKMSETLAAINQKRRQPMDVHALLTIFDSRTRFAKEIYEEVKYYFKDKLFKAIIHESVFLKEAAGAGQSIVQYDRDCQAFRDYFNLAVEYLERHWDRLLPSKQLGWTRVIENRYGPRRIPDGVLFQAVSKNAKGIEIAGDFNNWVPEPLIRRDEEGLWQKVIPIVDGRYRYKFIVDGEWQLDPYQPLQEKNAFGTFDSFLDLEVSSRG